MGENQFLVDTDILIAYLNRRSIEVISKIRSIESTTQL